MTNTRYKAGSRPGIWALCAAFLLVAAVSHVSAQSGIVLPVPTPTATPVAADLQAGGQAAAQPEPKPTIEIYGFGQADAIVDFKRNNPDWYDVNRPSKLPSFPGEFGENHHFYLSPRQSRFGAKGTLPTASGDVRAVFEFDMFGVGRDAGLTTIRLRHAYGQWKQVGAGQTDSQFMDVDIFPNILDYWGPNGMLYFRNTQVFWEPYNDGESNVRVAIENPGASGDAGIFSDRIELDNIIGRFPAPDLTGHYRWGHGWGYVQFGGALRYIAWDDLLPDDPFDLAGHVWGWGASISSNVKPTSNDTLRLQVVYGEGVENYFNDAPVDVGIKLQPGNRITPVTGEALPDLGIVAFLDHNWNSKWSTAVGYSRVDIDNSDGQTPAAFKDGQYGTLNLLCVPVTNVMMGGEFQWGRRENKSDGFTFDDFRLQFSLKYSFSFKGTGE
jgi:DcaP outer membrane protein